MKNKLILYFTKVCKLLALLTGSRNRRNNVIQKKLASYEFSILCNNCIGGVFLHDAGKRFNSPLVNLATDGDGFIKLLENPHPFIDGADNFKEYIHPTINHPHGILNDVTFNFVHYKTFDEAVNKWKTRGQRFVWDDIYVIATGHDGLERTDLMERFDKLPYKNKIMFTFKKWNYPWAIHVSRAHGVCRPFTEFASLNGKRFYETAFDIPSWIEDCEKGRNDRNKR